MIAPSLTNNVERTINAGNELLGEHPSDFRLKTMLLSLEELRNELSKSSKDLSRIKQIGYGVTRVFQDILEFEHTSFGKELGILLIGLNNFVDAEEKKLPSIDKLLTSVREQTKDSQIIDGVLEKLSKEKYRQVFQIFSELKQSGKWIPDDDDEKELERFWWEYAN